MEDLSLRLEFSRAIDAVAPPAPWIGPRVRERLREESERPLKRERRRPADLAWLLAVIAMLLAVAIVVTLVAGSHLLTPKVVPVKPNPGATAPCPEWGFIPGGASAPASIKMMSATIGWAPGDLRTTDGGAHWHDVSPKQLRSDQPFLPGQQTAYPPSYTEFFLDANHAWLARSYESSSVCFDHIATFSTSDGGQTWHMASVIVPQILATTASQLTLNFLDTHHGWMMISAQRISVVYSSDDGGQSWRLISSHGPSCPAFVFSTPTTGWSACGAANSNNVPPLSVTHDGGVSWSFLSLADASLPVFFDAQHGAGLFYTNDTSGTGEGIYSTTDGGAAWQTTTFSVVGGLEPYPVVVDFAGPADFWTLVTPPGFGKGSPVAPTDWLYHSADAGATWQLAQKNTPISSPTTIDFVDQTVGFVLQQDYNNATPELLVTRDGGHTWTVFQIQIS